MEVGETRTHQKYAPYLRVITWRKYLIFKVAINKIVFYALAYVRTHMTVHNTHTHTDFFPLDSRTQGHLKFLMAALLRTGHYYILTQNYHL